jgi:hypothetical protein
MLEAALSFFYECHAQELIFRITTGTAKPKTKTKAIRRKTSQNSNNYKESWRFLSEGLVPLSVTGLQKFAMDNSTIWRTAVRILGAAVGTGSTNKNQQQQVLLAELTAGAIEALAPFPTLERVCDTVKDEIRGLIRTIVRVWDGLE